MSVMRKKSERRGRGRARGAEDEQRQNSDRTATDQRQIGLCHGCLSALLRVTKAKLPRARETKWSQLPPTHAKRGEKGAGEGGLHGRVRAE